MYTESSVFRKIYSLPLILSDNQVDDQVDHQLKYDVIRANTVHRINTTHIASILEQSY